jgi:hypothetical protein
MGHRTHMVTNAKVRYMLRKKQSLHGCCLLWVILGGEYLGWGSSKGRSCPSTLWFEEEGGKVWPGFAYLVGKWDGGSMTEGGWLSEWGLQLKHGVPGS